MTQVAHDWIIDPQHRTALTLVLQDNQYVEASRFGETDTLTSPLFPGLEIPLRRVFR